MRSRDQLRSLLNRAWDRERARVIAGDDPRELAELLREASGNAEVSDEDLALDWAGLKCAAYPPSEREAWFAFWACFAKAMISQDAGMLEGVAELADLVLPDMSQRLRELAKRPDNPILMRLAFLAAVRGVTRIGEAFWQADPRFVQPKGGWH